MRLIEKQNELKKAIEKGVPKRRINPENHGKWARKLINGDEIPEEKINRMYENLLAYRNNPSKYREINESYRDYLPEITAEKKIKEILHAAESGVAKSHLDPAGIGDGVRQLQKGKHVGKGKLNEMYVRLLTLKGEKPPEPVTEPKKGKKHIEKDLAIQVLQQQKQIDQLKNKLNTLQKQLKSLQKADEANEKPKKQTIRVLGVNVVEKTDKVRGKKYNRWYGTFRESGKQHWIYIGVDITKAREKIRNYLEKKKALDTCNR